MSITLGIFEKNLFLPGLIAETIAASPGILATTGTMFTEQKNADSSSSATTIGVVIAVIFLITIIVATVIVVAVIFLRRQEAQCPLIISKTVYVKNTDYYFHLQFLHFHTQT